MSKLDKGYLPLKGPEEMCSVLHFEDATFLCNRTCLKIFLHVRFGRTGCFCCCSLEKGKEDQSVAYRCLVCLILRHVFLSHSDV